MRRRNGIHTDAGEVARDCEALESLDVRFGVTAMGDAAWNATPVIQHTRHVSNPVRMLGEPKHELEVLDVVELWVEAAYRDGEGSENGDTPMFFVIACDDPHPETWLDIQAALDGDE